MSKKNGKKLSKKNEQKENTTKLSAWMTKFEYLEIEYTMHFTENRLASFKNWPFDEDSTCNPNSLSDAGFYHIPTNESPDATRCFCCYKELDGWEPEDDPWSEHKKHSPKCAYLGQKKPVLDLTVEEFLKMECEREKCKIRKYFHAKKQEWENQKDLGRAEMMKLNPN